MFHSRQDGQGRHLLPQAASSPPQGPNTLHIYIGAWDAANTVHLFLSKLLNTKKPGILSTFPLPLPPLLVMRAVFCLGAIIDRKEIPQLEQRMNTAQLLIHTVTYS